MLTIRNSALRWRSMTKRWLVLRCVSNTTLSTNRSQMAFPFSSGLSLKCIHLFVLQYFKIHICILVCFLYRYTFYSLLKHSFDDKVRMLYTDTDLFFLQFLVDDLAKEINSRPQLRDAFDFTEIDHTHLLLLRAVIADVNGGEIDYFRMKPKKIRTSNLGDYARRCTRSPYAAEPSTQKELTTK